MIKDKRYDIHLIIIDNQCKLPTVEKKGYTTAPGTWRINSNVDNIEDFNKDIINNSDNIISYFNKIKNDERI